MQQKARDNRAALRINKVQMTSESLRRQQQECIDSVSRPDVDLPFKDQIKQKESEHEQEWKFRQVIIFLLIHNYYVRLNFVLYLVNNL